MSVSGGVREFLLAFADDEHLMGQQHTEWIGVAPFLEEDLAFSSIGQDELGHAALLYEIVLGLDGVEPDDEAVDALAFRRASSDYRSCHLVEYTTHDWAEALVRHWIYDTFETMRWQLVAESSLPELRAVSKRALREERFHIMHADALLDKLLCSDEAGNRLMASLDSLRPLIGGVCEPTEGEAAAVSQGVSAASTASLLPSLQEAIAKRFNTPEHVSVAAGISEPVSGAVAKRLDTPERAEQAVEGVQCRRTVRSDDFGPLMTRMREVLDYDPQARW